jgi:hypothetical protein
MLNTICNTCNNSIWCDTWGEFKCTAKKRYIYSEVAECEDYTKMAKNTKQQFCQCEDCLKNEKLAEERGEEE